MRRRILATGLALVTLAVVAAGPVAASGSHHKTFEFDSMIGVQRPFTGSTNPVRGINGGGLPWVIGSAEGELSRSGRLELEIRHLVIDPNDPAAIAAGLAGKNPIASFRAVVSCANADGSFTNVSSDPFPVTTGLNGGSGELETKLMVPSSCMDPMVFVTSPGGAWFARTNG